MDLFDYKIEQIPEGKNKLSPLAELLRPSHLSLFFTSDKTAAHLHSLRKTIEKSGRMPNLILWGPPGTGKTTLALILSKMSSETKFIQVNAVDTGAKKLKEIGNQAKEAQRLYGTFTVLFIDEIHRLNKAQQDILLPFTEAGHLSLIGATTENPGYELNAALLSRSRVITLERHTTQSLSKILQQVEATQNFKISECLTNEALEYLFHYADGDARKFLNVIEQLIGDQDSQPATSPKSQVELKKILDSQSFHYDKSSDQHYDTISAFIKSIRGSDPDAAVYYLARMLEGGEDPKFIARRLIILASEDIGNADPRALTMATSSFQAVEKIGLPEAAISLAQVTCYLACCPKSNRAYEALKRAQAVVRKTGHLPIPKSLRSAQIRFAKDQGYGEGYQYSHEGPKGYVEQRFLPDSISSMKFYELTERGFEKNLSDYLAWLKK